jgi:cytochrome bd ubiquinol oxidase subunit II
MAAALIAVVWTSVTLYAVFGGADFGAGILHLVVRTPYAERQRRTIVKAMGPVWEANHVWLILAVTGLFTAFPRAFQALGTLLFAPATLALIAIAIRGAALGFAAAAEAAPRAQALFMRLFGGASLAGAFLLGTAAGGLARARGGYTGFVIGPFELAIGALAVAICASLAATFLTVECRRAGDERLAGSFRALALRCTGAVAVLALGGLALAHGEASSLFGRLTDRTLPEVLLALVALASAMLGLHQRYYSVARTSLGIAVAAVMWGWGLAQYPRIAGPGTTIASAAATEPDLTAVTIALAAGLVLLVPSIWVLYVAFRRQPLEVHR